MQSHSSPGPMEASRKKLYKGLPKSLCFDTIIMSADSGLSYSDKKYRKKKNGPGRVGEKNTSGNAKKFNLFPSLSPYVVSGRRESMCKMHKMTELLGF